MLGTPKSLPLYYIFLLGRRKNFFLVKTDGEPWKLRMYRWKIRTVHGWTSTEEGARVDPSVLKSELDRVCTLKMNGCGAWRGWPWVGLHTKSLDALPSAMSASAKGHYWPLLLRAPWSCEGTWWIRLTRESFILIWTLQIWRERQQRGNVCYVCAFRVILFAYGFLFY